MKTENHSGTVLTCSASTFLKSLRAIIQYVWVKGFVTTLIKHAGEFLTQGWVKYGRYQWVGYILTWVLFTQLWVKPSKDCWFCPNLMAGLYGLFDIL